MVGNNFQRLEYTDNMQPEEEGETAWTGPSYAAALSKPSNVGPQMAQRSARNHPEPNGIAVTQEDLDTQISQLSRQIGLLRQRMARFVDRRKERAAMPPPADTQISPAPQIGQPHLTP